MIFRVYELYDGIIYRHLYTFVNLCSWNFLTSKAHFFKIYLWTFLTFSATQKNLTPRSLECPWGDGGQRVCRAWFLLRAVRQSQLRPESLKWKVTEAVNRQDDERLFSSGRWTFWWSEVMRRKSLKIKNRMIFFRMMLNGWSGSIDLSNWQESWKLGQCPLDRSWTGLVGLTNWIHNYVSLFVEYRDESARRTAFGMTDVN